MLGLKELYSQDKIIDNFTITHIKILSLFFLFGPELVKICSKPRNFITAKLTEG